jgi:hypothetical protein
MIEEMLFQLHIFTFTFTVHIVTVMKLSGYFVQHPHNFGSSTTARYFRNLPVYLSPQKLPGLPCCINYGKKVVPLTAEE